MVCIFSGCVSMDARKCCHSAVVLEVFLPQASTIEEVGLALEIHAVKLIILFYVIFTLTTL